jgi:hypothetical protein
MEFIIAGIAARLKKPKAIATRSVMVLVIRPLSYSYF